MNVDKREVVQELSLEAHHSYTQKHKGLKLYLFWGTTACRMEQYP